MPVGKCKFGKVEKEEWIWGELGEGDKYDQFMFYENLKVYVYI